VMKLPIREKVALE